MFSLGISFSASLFNLANNSANAHNIETEPPSRHSFILSTYNIYVFDADVGDDTTSLNGLGAWAITNVSDGGGDKIYTWSPNLGPEHTKAGEESPEDPNILILNNVIGKIQLKDKSEIIIKSSSLHISKPLIIEFL